jgi:hypothetical protein
VLPCPSASASSRPARTASSTARAGRRRRLGSATTCRSPTTLTLDDSWSGYWGNPIRRINGGCYIFLGAQPPSGIADALDALLGGLNAGYQGVAYRYVLWIAAATSPLVQTGAIPFAQSGNAGAVAQAASVALRTLQLTADVGITLAPGADAA